MKRRLLLTGAAGVPLAALAGPAPQAAQAAQAALPAVLQRPALATALAPGAAMLALARAGSRVVAAGERGLVLTSDDGGRHWAQARVPVQVSLTALRFADARQGWAAGHLGTLLRSGDGGASWTLALHGVQAAQLTIDATADPAQRAAAQRLLDDGPDKPFFDLEAQGGQVLAVGAYGLALASADGGQQWSAIGPRLPNPKRLHLYAVRRLGERVFIAGEQGLLMRSSDGGASFEPLASPYKGSFFGLLATPAGSLLAYGLRGNAFRSTDGGNSWAACKTGVPVSLSAGLARPDGQLLLLAQNGDVLTSRDDGQTFDRRPAAPPFPATALVPAEGRTLVLAGLRGLQRLDNA